jgi:hypothetical protein
MGNLRLLKDFSVVHQKPLKCHNFIEKLTKSVVKVYTSVG